ncbi:MAG: glutamine synthetase type III, partial [Thermoleophilaceae bacterium]|nr:glutamine synthetase type III [Thermoleophilaceae bacterium]
LNTIVAESIDELSDSLEQKLGGSTDLPGAVGEVVKEAYSANKAVCFSGDNYAEEWHAEAQQRGLKNLRTSPDALPEVVAPDTVATFGKYEVLSERELESRYEVWLEQYSMTANIEAETTATIARTQLLPAALRQLELEDRSGVEATKTRPLTEEFIRAIDALDEANVYPDDIEGLDLAVYARDTQLARMDSVREVADQLEGIVADDLWPLPKYSEMLFIK